MLSISEEDLQGFMEVIHRAQVRNLDLILHTPGGSPTATESIVSYLRSKFDSIRIIVPHAAMSAGTMLSCAANSVVLARHSSLGPVDPQMIIATALGVRMVPAQAILDQFAFAMEDCKDVKKLPAWMPILSQYGPGLLVECQNALKLSERLTREWLEKYMFAAQPPVQRKRNAKRIAGILSDHSRFRTHSRHINRQAVQAMGMIVEELEADQRLQDLVLSVYHATTHTFGMTTSVKIIENQLDRAFLKLAHMQQVAFQVPPQVAPPPGAIPPPPPGPPQNVGV